MPGVNIYEFHYPSKKKKKNSTYRILTCPLDLSVRGRKAEMCEKKEGNGGGDKMS